MTEILSPLDPNLRPFKNRGGKLIMYHGWADPAISAYGTLDYYEKVTKAVGGQREADAFSRLYLVPGMHHCSGGPGPNTFDMLTALEDWVEHGMAPAQVVATHAIDGKVDRTRPLCPHPQVARYTGSGDVDDAASFRCGHEGYSASANSGSCSGSADSRFDLRFSVPLSDLRPVVIRQAHVIRLRSGRRMSSVDIRTRVSRPLASRLTLSGCCHRMCQSCAANQCSVPTSM